MSGVSQTPRLPAAARIHAFLSNKDLTGAATIEVLELARTIKAALKRGEQLHLLEGKTLAMIFQKPSLRTRVSFEIGMTQLGGHAIYLGPDDIALGKRETTEDIAIVLSGMADLIMARVFGHEIVADLGKYATVPVINGLSDLEHPCQCLADMLTVLERKGTLAGQRLVFVGDGNNVANSLLYGGALTGMSVTVACPLGYEPPAELVADARKIGASTGAKIEVTSELKDACRGADVLYTDVWTSMGQEAEKQARLKAFAGYQIDTALLGLAKPDAIILHCLPAHYGEEIEYAASRTPNSAIFQQAENRLHAQKALMVAMAG